MMGGTYLQLVIFLFIGNYSYEMGAVIKFMHAANFELEANGNFVKDAFRGIQQNTKSL